VEADLRTLGQPERVGMAGRRSMLTVVKGARARVDAWQRRNRLPRVVGSEFNPAHGSSNLHGSVLALVVGAPVATLATRSGTSSFVRPLLLVGMVALNSALYLTAFRVLSPRGLHMRQLAPGAVVGSLGFTILITVGSGLIQHQLRNSSATYGQFGVVVGLVGFLFLLAKISLVTIQAPAGSQA
jgi:hypothetical protein